MIQASESHDLLKVQKASSQHGDAGSCEQKGESGAGRAARIASSRIKSTALEAQHLGDALAALAPPPGTHNFCVFSKIYLVKGQTDESGKLAPAEVAVFSQKVAHGKQQMLTCNS